MQNFGLVTMEKQPFYAISYSKFNDPGKLFFHRTHYYELKEAGEKVIFAKAAKIF